jgi:hypothetical protein
MYRVTSLVVATLLMMSRAAYGLPPITLEPRHQAIILVRVLESTPNTFPIHGRVLVLRSWWGPFSPGQELRVLADVMCAGNIANCTPYPLRVGDELLVFTGEKNPIFISQAAAASAADSQSEMAELDRMVKQDQELQDPKTDVIRAPERDRVMRSVKECFAAASMHPEDTYARERCHVDVSVLNGIKRSELVASWGRPTSCEMLNSGAVPTANCGSEEAAIWSFGDPDSGLYCGPGRNLRCIGIVWVGFK